MDTVIEVSTSEGLYFQEQTRPIWKDAILEFIGTTFFVYISLAGVSQTVLSQTNSQLNVAICFALGLSTGIIISHPSGSHLNPAVSLIVYLTDKSFSAMRLVAYILNQLIGGVVAGLLVLAVYGSWIQKIEDKLLIGTFGTIKNSNNSLISSIIDQLIGSALLMISIVITPSSKMKPIIIGSVIGGLGLFQGSNGFAFNLARDLGPRISSIIVFGSLPFSAEDYWFWVPTIIPFFGVGLGMIIANSIKYLW